jgi:hypothetical protein
MHLVEILLPLTDQTGRPFPAEYFDALAGRLAEKFGGVTSFLRAPAEGRWHNGALTENDDIAVLEVMVREFERPWWTSLRAELEHLFQQEAVVIRATAIDLI